MADDPASYAEFNARFHQSEVVSGYGMNTTISSPCPFCAHPGWLSFKITGVRPAIERGATCEHCGRSARAIFVEKAGSVAFSIVQTGGDDPPAWFPTMRRV
jgi:hypothetical protein